MSRAKRLLIVLDLAEKHEQKAAEALEMARKLKDQDEQRLDDLAQYCADYEQTFRQPQTSMRAEDMQRQRGFLVQLNEAREQQSKIVDQRTSVLEHKRQQWQTAHLKRKAMSDLIDRFKQEEASHLSKQEEKMLDEWFNQTSQQRAERSLL